MLGTNRPRLDLSLREHDKRQRISERDHLLTRLARVEGGVYVSGTRGVGLEGAGATLVEVVDGIAHRL